MEDLLKFTGYVMIAFGILQIILFFKVWIMTNDVKSLKDMYAKRGEELSSSIAALTKAIELLKSPMNVQQKAIAKNNVETTEEKKVVSIPHEVIPEEIPIIDENSDEFKQRVRKWKILKGKGYTEQALKEYMEYTKRDKSIAIEFIDSI